MAVGRVKSTSKLDRLYVKRKWLVVVVPQMSMACHRTRCVSNQPMHTAGAVSLTGKQVLEFVLFVNTDLHCLTASVYRLKLAVLWEVESDATVTQLVTNFAILQGRLNSGEIRV